MKHYPKLLRWHRRIGVLSAIFVVILAITGLALNHTERLQLDQKFISSSAVLNWYNIAPPEAPFNFVTKNHHISSLGDRLYFDQQELEDSTGKLLGALEIEGLVIVATSEEIQILDQQGQLLEILASAEGVPTGIQQIGQSTDAQLIVQGTHGNYQVEINSLTWQKNTDQKINWSKPFDINEPLKSALLKAYRGKGLAIERLLLDLHSGRIFGNIGVFIFDAAAILFLILAATGIWMWSKK